MKLLPLLIIAGFVAVVAFKELPRTHKRVGQQIASRVMGVDVVGLEKEQELQKRGERN